MHAREHGCPLFKRELSAVLGRCHHGPCQRHHLFVLVPCHKVCQPTSEATHARSHSPACSERWVPHGPQTPNSRDTHLPVVNQLLQYVAQFTHGLGIALQRMKAAEIVGKHDETLVPTTGYRRALDGRRLRTGMRGRGPAGSLRNTPAPQSLVLSGVASSQAPARRAPPWPLSTRSSPNNQQKGVVKRHYVARCSTPTPPAPPATAQPWQGDEMIRATPFGHPQTAVASPLFQVASHPIQRLGAIPTPSPHANREAASSTPSISTHRFAVARRDRDDRGRGRDGARVSARGRDRGKYSETLRECTCKYERRTERHTEERHTQRSTHREEGRKKTS